MTKNLTLALDAELLKNARRYALEHDTTVNQMVRDLLAQKVASTGAVDASLAELEEIFRTCTVTMGKRSWTREDLYERR